MRLLSPVIGGFIGFIHGCVPAALIGFVYRSIPFDLTLDVAAGLGIGQAIAIIYVQLGRVDFINL